MLALEMLSPIAVTETAEVGTGWRRGDDGVTTGSPQAGAAAGGARLYNLRLPTEGLRQGHGLWLLAGARIEGLPPMPPTPESQLLRTRPCKTHLHTQNLPLRSRCETAKHHLETSPNQPKPQRQKTL